MADTKHPAQAMPDRENPVLRLFDEYGQSVWMDYIRRGILNNGDLERMIREYGLRGVTSNPSIFEKAFSESDDYDSALEEYAGNGPPARGVFEVLAIEDIQRGCDLFHPLYDESGGTDGFVSLEVSPELADDTAATLEEARRLWRKTDRPNVMIKVPGTSAGIPAIEQLLYEGLNINITLLFSVHRYEQVIEAYLRGLERRIEEAKPIHSLASVASFFVSRVDTAVDAELEKLLERETSEERRSRIRPLFGKIAIANAKMAYQRFSDVFSGDRFARLRAEGAHVQRPLWASTSTKNPDYRDVLYVEELIGPDTVNTMPLETLEAFADHGVVRRTVDDELDDAHEHLATLGELGIDLDQVTAQLQQEGVEKFAKAFHKLIHAVETELGRVAGRV